MKYIDAEKLMAEMERLKDGIGIGLCEYDAGEENGKMEILTELSSLITSLQQKQPPLSSNLDEAANNYGIDIRLGYPRIMDKTDRYIYNAFKAGAEWLAEQGVSMEITDETKWADVDTFVHRNCDGDKVIVQIRKKEE